jgi:hypothetical protein
MRRSWHNRRGAPASGAANADEVRAASGTMRNVNADQVESLRALLAPTGWVERTALFADALRRSSRTPHGLLVLGSATDEPWHMTAHLEDESRWADRPELWPTLVRWAPPQGARPHLSVGLDRLREADRRHTLLVVSGEIAQADLLERVDDVRRLGATVLALDRGDPELDGLAHESLAVPEATAPVTFDAAQHLVSAAAGDQGSGRRAHPRGPGGEAPAGLRSRLARLLDSVTGTQAK